MKFHFIFLLLIDGSSFFSECFSSSLRFCRRLITRLYKARFSLFFVFIKLINISVKTGIISKNIRWEILTNVFFTDSVFEYMLLFFLQWKKWQRVKSYQCVTFLHNVLEKLFYSLCGCPSISVLYVLRGIYIFEMFFSFSCLIRL